jgi:hypothetical protein
MKLPRSALRLCVWLCLGAGFIAACGFDDTLREYLDARFWQPFSKQAWHFEKKNVVRVYVSFAGMEETEGESSLAKLRRAYRPISEPATEPFDPAKLHEAVAAARADQSLSRRDREEVDLLDAKIDMRAGEPADEPDLLQSAERKLEAFLQSAKTPEFLSEARGWLAHIHFLFGEQTAAGKTYLDELNQNGSNLDRDTLLNSLQMTYGYDGGPDLLEHLEEYFDTPEHAAFAVQMITNPHWNSRGFHPERADGSRETWVRVKTLLQKHRSLLASADGSNALAVLGMRTALRMGDPPAVVQIASMVPARATIRQDPDFAWMLASAYFLSRQYEAAEGPLLGLFHSSRSSDNQKSAAAYGLCGVYSKTGNRIEQLRFALWLRHENRTKQRYLDYPGTVDEQSVYWAASGWDLGLLLDAEVPVDTLESFLNRYPNVPDVRLVRYSLAVRLARENRYEEAADIYQAIHADRRAERMRELADLYRDANRTDLSGQQLAESNYKLAKFISANPERLYFNDQLWSRFQRYALTASADSRLTRQERQLLMDRERKLKDDQEERWRAYSILRGIVKDSGNSETGRQAAELAIDCLRSISDRFGRQDEIRRADFELSKWLRQMQKPPA